MIEILARLVGASEGEWAANLGRSPTDEDIAQSGGSVVNFEQAVNVVSPHLCKVFNLVDTGADEDHMLLTPSAGDSDLFLTYSIEYPRSTERSPRSRSATRPTWRSTTRRPTSICW